MKHLLIISVLLIFLFSCGNSNNANKTKPIVIKEILIHCGSTMEKPIIELANIFENRENCIVKITTGGSGNLYNSIKSNKTGDIFIPGLEKYIKNGIKDGFINEAIFVGINKAAIMVKKGNPKNIEQTISCLSDERYKIVIGNPDYGSIGKETKSTLQNIGIFDDVNNRAEYLTIDSRDLIKAIRSNEADIIINWFATSTWNENIDFVEVLDTKEDIFEEKNIYIATLLYSQYPLIAKKFIEFASSEKGKSIFQKYGLYNKHTTNKLININLQSNEK